jgi:hypothetical protein
MELYIADGQRQTYTGLQRLAVFAALLVVCTITESPVHILLESLLASLVESLVASLLESLLKSLLKSLLESLLERASHREE